MGLFLQGGGQQQMPELLKIPGKKTKMTSLRKNARPEPTMSESEIVSDPSKSFQAMKSAGEPHFFTSCTTWGLFSILSVLNPRTFRTSQPLWIRSTG